MWEYFKDWRMWLTALAIFAVTEFTLGCSALTLRDRGVNYERVLSEDLSANVRCTLTLKSYRVTALLTKTF